MVYFNLMTEYFQDILPPDEDKKNRPVRAPQTEARSIRNVTLPTRRVTTDVPDRTPVAEPGRDVSVSHVTSNKKSIAPWLWALIGAVVLVACALAFFLLRPTTVTLVPRVQNVVLESLPSLTAYPASSNATGTLAYDIQTLDLEESATVQAQGLRHVDRKASGSITVFNNYAATPVKLLANTRFETPEGLVFRTPTAISIPGKSGGKPGSVSVTVVADEAGDKYNVVSAKFMLPGLKSGPMYDTVYATSNAAFSGGFSGDEPATDSSVLAAAQAGMRGRVEQKIRAMFTSSTSTLFALPDIAWVSYTDLPTTQQEGESGTVILRQRAHAVIPVFDAREIAAAVASAAGVDVRDVDIQLVRGADFAARPLNADGGGLGSVPLSFALSGHAQLLWRVDIVALAQALAGRDVSAFETIAKGFPGIEDASARIEPFWSSSFPQNPDSIRIIISTPAAL